MSVLAINKAITAIETSYKSQQFPENVLTNMIRQADIARDNLREIILELGNKYTNENFFKLGMALKNLQVMLHNVPLNIKKNNLEGFTKKFKNSKYNNVDIKFSQLMNDIIKYNKELQNDKKVQELITDREEQDESLYGVSYLPPTDEIMRGRMPNYEGMYNTSIPSTTQSPPTGRPGIFPPRVGQTLYRHNAVTGHLPTIPEGGRRKRRTKRSKSRRNKSYRKRN